MQTYVSLPELYQHYQQCSGISTDTRSIGPGDMFFALRGEHFDANAFAEKALAAGAAFAVIDRPEYAHIPGTLWVEDALKALQQLAHYHRLKLSIPIIGIGGSNGKTTTKELLKRVLAKRYRLTATAGNLNNYIGVPLTVLSIGSATELALIELGANRRGDIAELVGICLPTHGLITNIGKSHLEGFGGLAGVAAGEGELYDFLVKTEGRIFYNADDPVLTQMLDDRNAEEKWLRPYRTDLSLLTSNPTVSYFAENQEIKTHLMGDYNFTNMRAALTVGQYFEVPEADMHAAIAEYIPHNNRSEVIAAGSNTLWMDAYNANPSSMEAALRNFAALPGPLRKMVILGDMFELGDEAAAEHAGIGRVVAACGFDTVLLVGELMQYALPALPQAYYFPDKFGLHVWLQDHPQAHTHVLVKGSRGMKLESVREFLGSPRP